MPKDPLSQDENASSQMSEADDGRIVSSSAQHQQGRGGKDGIFRADDDDDGYHNHHGTSPRNQHTAGIASFQRRHDFWHTLAGIVGNVLEWYDFAVFGFFSDEIGQVFFPNANDPVAQSFAVFGGAFLFRPVGGVLLGYLGDVYGREKALRISIFLMAFPTFAMGCLPTYNQVGTMAVVLLILIRILQGLSVGGQLMSSLVFTLEGHPVEHWGVYGSFVMAAANFGTLLGNLVATFLQASLTPEQLETWGWRLPFWSGILVSLSGFYLKSSEGGHHYQGPASGNGHNSPATGTEQSSNQNMEGSTSNDATQSSTRSTNPLGLAFSKGNRRSLLASAMVPCLWSAGFYLSFVWMATFMKEMLDPPVPHSFSINAMSLFLSVCLFFPVAGKLSDKFGRRPIMTSGALGLGIGGPILFYVIRLRDPLSALIAQCLLGVFLSFWGAPMCAWLVESFDPAARLTSVAIGYNIAQATAGGMAPMVATVLTDDVSRQAPGWILTVLSIIAMTGLWVVAPNSQATFAPDPTMEMTPRQHHDNDIIGENRETDEDDDDDDNELL